jgi:hypothetical protein
MKLIAKSIALAVLVLVAAGPSYAQPLRSTSIPSRLADESARSCCSMSQRFSFIVDVGSRCELSCIAIVVSASANAVMEIVQGKSVDQPCTKHREADNPVSPPHTI